SFEKRNPLQDSITINFRFLDSSRMQKFDSSIMDFSKKFPVPWSYFDLGNVGNAAHNMIFSPLMKPGFDQGFHAYDIYNFNDYETRFYNTTRPYSELNYILGSAVEQIIEVKHTQNVMPNWNVAFQYRLISSPGFFQNQNSNHNNYRLNSWYQSKNKRYQNFLVLIGNKLLSGENGGIRNDLHYLDTIGFETRSAIPTKLGANLATGRDFFSSNVPTGTFNTNASYLLRQQYDIGQKDSIVTDSSVIPLFYPRLRVEHTINLKTYNYRFSDAYPDTLYYRANYKIDPSIPYHLRDSWRRLVNDVSIYTFPDAKNSQQFFRAGATFESLKGTFDTGTVSHKYTNLFLHGEYRNKTRNQKWDVEAYGNLYLSGMNSGDYDAHISLKRLISKRVGYLQAGFGNVNRTPSYVYDSISSFYLGKFQNFKKENNTEIFGTLDLSRLQLKLGGKYLLLSNYSYFSSFSQAAQYPTIFNMLQISVEKQFNLGRNWHWRTWTVFQQLAGSAPVHVPLILSRNQVGYDGKLGFKNLLISFGLEFRYYTPYKADSYSPLIGQWVNQNTTIIKMKLPEIGAYIHFRIKSFTAYIRAENLNSFNTAKGSFTKNNIVSPDYPYPGLQLRLGVFWSFIN
ncbi:MAG: putative porin, partial [Flavitalea sp.]